MFDCDGDVSFTVRTGPGEAALWAPAAVGAEYRVLGMTTTASGQLASASGLRYEDGDLVFVHDGDVATFEIGRKFADCRANQRKVPWADAARRGVTFRALGNGPSWHLEGHPDRLAMITELAARRTELPYAEPVVQGRRTTFRASDDGHEIVAVVGAGPGQRDPRVPEQIPQLAGDRWLRKCGSAQRRGWLEQGRRARADGNYRVALGRSAQDLPLVSDTELQGRTFGR